MPHSTLPVPPPSGLQMVPSLDQVRNPCLRRTITFYIPLFTTNKLILYQSAHAVCPLFTLAHPLHPLSCTGRIILYVRTFVTCRTVHVSRGPLVITRCKSHVTRHTSHVTRHTSHVTRHTSHVTRHTSHVTQASSDAVLHPLATTAICVFEVFCM